MLFSNYFYFVGVKTTALGMYTGLVVPWPNYNTGLYPPIDHPELIICCLPLNPLVFSKPVCGSKVLASYKSAPRSFKFPKSFHDNFPSVRESSVQLFSKDNLVSTVDHSPFFCGVLLCGVCFISFIALCYTLSLWSARDWNVLGCEILESSLRGYSRSTPLEWKTHPIPNFLRIWNTLNENPPKIKARSQIRHAQNVVWSKEIFALRRKALDFRSKFSKKKK